MQSICRTNSELGFVSSSQHQNADRAGNQCPSNKVILICATSKTAHHTLQHGAGCLDSSPEILLSLHAQKWMPGGWTVGMCWRVWGGGESLKKINWMAAPSWGCLAEDLSDSRSVGDCFSLTRQPRCLEKTDARDAAWKTASGPAGENWAKLTAHILQHTQTHHAMAYCLTVLQPSCISIGSAKIMYSSGGGLCGWWGVGEW